MDCCQCQGLERLFDQKTARNDAKAYRKNGPDKTTGWLIEALTERGLAGRTLLDIGGGAGAIQHELLRAGAGQATHVDASQAYLAASREVAQQLGHAERVSYQHGNFVELAPQLEPADIVTLDRVICCYHDVESLVRQSVGRAIRLYGVVYPREIWYTRLGCRLINAISWLQRAKYRFFIHPTATVESILADRGFTRCFYRTSFLWQIAIYERPDA